MANYGYLYLKRKITPKGLETKLRAAVQDWFGDRMQVKTTEWLDAGPVWLVYIPNSAPSNAMSYNKAPGDDFGFTVALQNEGRIVAFRHARNSFEHWCQGCIEEQLADVFKVGIFYDATGRTSKPGVRSYRRRRRFGSYAARHMEKPLAAKDVEYLDYLFKSQTPEGWW